MTGKFSARTNAEPTLIRGLELVPRWGRIQKSLGRQTVSSILGQSIVLVLIIVGIIGPFLAPHDPVQVDVSQRLQPPSDTYLLGTDELGRDVFSRILHGARATLTSVVVVLSIAVVLGIPIGAISGYVEGWLEEILMRISDLVLAFPALVLAMVLVVVLGPSLTTAMFAVAFVRWPRYARLVRGQVLSVKRDQFVEAARATGATDARILIRHILPNCLNPVLVRATLDAGYIILTIASLSFLGLGAQQPQPEWGLMVATGRTYMINYWWVGLFPGLAIMIAVTGFVLVGDMLRDRLDPTLRGVR